MKKTEKHEPEKKKDSKPAAAPKPSAAKAAESSGGASSSAGPKFIWTGNLCACGEPVALGQSEVCVAHQRSR